ncbi:hypothetical protein BKA82DRAFT_2235975 [Pisolithus tinctorius]|nr:hypothetical protein BKA82DRAFT_2235975 [Pisolithus tinctorius]
MASMQDISHFATSVGSNSRLGTIPSWLPFFHRNNFEVCFVLSLCSCPPTSISYLVDWNATCSQLAPHPQHKFATMEGISELVNFFIAWPGASIAFVAPTLVSDTLNETSVTPAWRDSLWDVRPHVL